MHGQPIIKIFYVLFPGI